MSAWTSEDGDSPRRCCASLGAQQVPPHVAHRRLVHLHRRLLLRLALPRRFLLQAGQRLGLPLPPFRPPSEVRILVTLCMSSRTAASSAADAGVRASASASLLPSRSGPHGRLSSMRASSETSWLHHTIACHAAQTISFGANHGQAGCVTCRPTLGGSFAVCWCICAWLTADNVCMTLCGMHPMTAVAMLSI